VPALALPCQLLSGGGTKAGVEVHMEPTPAIPASLPPGRCTLVFLCFKYNVDFLQAVDRLVDKLGPACGSGSGVNVNMALNGLTMDVIGLTAFG